MKWTRTRLGNLCSVVTKGTTPRTLGKGYSPDGTPFLRAENLLGDDVVLGPGTLFIDDETHKLLSRSVIMPGDVLISIAGTIGRCAVVPRDMPTMNCNQAVAIARINGPLDRRLLIHWLKTNDAQRQMSGAKVTQTISNLSLGQIRKLNVPLPPLSEQRRIVEILDQADALRRKRAEADTKAARILPALFYWMFGDPATNTMGWDTVSLGSITSLVTSGLTPRGGSENYVKRGPYFLRSQNIQMNCLDLSHAACLPPEIHEAMSRTKVQCGDVLLNITGASIGRVAWYDIPNHEANVNQHVCIIRLTPEACPEYVSYVLSTTYGQLVIDRAQTGATRQGLNHENVRRITIPFPPVEIQTNFAHIVQQHKTLEMKCQESHQDIKGLFDTLLHRAFSGDLTARWREAHLKELLAEMEQQAKALEAAPGREQLSLQLG